MNPFIVLTSTIVFVYLYFIMSQYFAHRRFNYLQETSVAITIGLIVGVFVFFFSDFFQSQNQQTIRDIIFLILLPPIMFEDGYNFPKRKFFQNIFYVNLYGLLGTIFNFLFMWGFLFLFNQLGLFLSISDNNEVISFYNWQILLLAACLCSIEPIVTEKVVDKERYPKLFSIIFGESLFKDTIAITLFDSIKDMVNDNTDNFDIQSSDIGFLILRFLQVVACSVLIGVIVGLITTIIFKNLRFLLQEKGISEMAMTLLTGYLGYVISEWLSFSGVISMLFSGIVLSHYNVYNMTEQGKQATKITVDVLKITASGLIFFFIGFQIYDIQSFQSTIDQTYKSCFSLSLLGYTFLIMLVGRVFNVYLTSLIGYFIIGKDKWKLNFYQYFIIYLMGLVHGAVPFALSVTLPYNQLLTTNTIQLNIICIVLITSFLLNIFIPKIMKIMLARVRQLEASDPSHPSVKDSFLQRPAQIINNKQTVIEDNKINAPLLTKFKSTTQKYWRKFEEGVLKPHLIFDYYQRKTQIKLDKLKKRKEQHEKYLARMGNSQNNQNLLDANDQQNNKYIEIVFSNYDSDSEQNDEGKLFIKKEKPENSEEDKKKIAKTKKEDKRLQKDKQHAKSKQKEQRKKLKKQPSQKNVPRPTQTQIVCINIRQRKQSVKQKNDIDLKQKLKSGILKSSASELNNSEPQISVSKAEIEAKINRSD